MISRRAVASAALGGPFVIAALLAGGFTASPAGGSRSQVGPDALAPPTRKLGPLGADRALRLELSLVSRDRRGLERLIGAGRTISPASFASRFLPSAAAVGAAINQLHGAGLRVTWTPGSQVLQADGPAAAAERAFGVPIERYGAVGGQTFYAPVGSPRLPGALRGVVGAVAGLNDRERVQNLGLFSFDTFSKRCGQDPGGYTPAQILSAYHFGPLTRDGLTGAGQTVAFIETDTFRAADLACFQGQFGEPPFDVTVAPGHWGSPTVTPASGSGASETDLDLEVVHAIAPAAHLVVYYTDGTVGDVAAAFQAAVSAHPKAIVSVSLGGCEIEATDGHGDAVAAPDETVWHNGLARLAATGGTAFVSSGDSGAYQCGSQFRNPSTGDQLPMVSAPASDPYATAVGGTSLFIGANGSYGGEAAWGSPFEVSGSGGGLSSLWAEPSWQAAAALHNGYSNGHRQLPDVSALGDPSTGWDIFQSGSWGVVGGTSAAAPLWAGLTAIADQVLARYHLAPVGFANLPLYSFGEDPSKWPAPAFNDVTRGANLYYPATPGWDYATGWGSPNASGLVDDLLAYRERKR
jgi:kumamolisin